MPEPHAHWNSHMSVDGGGTQLQVSPVDIQSYLLSSDRHARVHRELWNNGHCTYLDLRNFILAQRSRAHTTSAIVKRPSAMDVTWETASTTSSTTTSTQPTFQPSAAYTFVGMRCVLDVTKAAVTLIRFANVRSDMLAYAVADGNLWVVRNLQSPKATPIKAPAVHRHAITSLDWAPDNSYLLTASVDGLTVWDVSDLTPVRTIATPVAASAITAAIFHCLSSNLILTGNASGNVDVINLSTGGHSLTVPAFKKSQKGVEVSVLEVSAHHVFVGDNKGWLHLHKQEIPKAGHLERLTHVSRVWVAAGEFALIGCCYIPFCQATAAPALLVTARDSTIAIVKLAKENLLEVTTRCIVYPPMARDIRAVPCPLSVLHCDLPRVIMGSEDTGVHIYNLSALKTTGAGAKGGGSALGRPLIVTTLRGHRSPVAAVSWSFDELFLASADCNGMVIVWERATA